MNFNFETYQPRGSFVLIKVVEKGMAGKLALPQQSAAGKELHVVSVGPDVKDLKRGDIVFAIGQKGIDLVFLPSSTSHFVIRESNVVLVIPPEEV